MDYNTLTRRELQALCKRNGIPANKTNVFMAEALAKKRIPLSKVDANKDQKTVHSIASPPLKSPHLLFRKNKTTDGNGTGPKQQNPPLFQNNFLRRGKRKDAPTSHETNHEEKPKMQRLSNSHSDLQESPIGLSQRSVAGGAMQLKNVKTETIAAQAVSTKAKVDSGLSGLKSDNLSDISTREENVESRLKSENHPGIAVKEAKEAADMATFHNSTSAAKEKIEDRVQSQIEDALRSKVMKAPERWPSAPTSVESFERALESNMTVDKVDRNECLNLPLEHPGQEEKNIQVTVENSEVFKLPLNYPEQRIVGFSFLEPLACQIATTEENALVCTPAVHAAQRSASLDLIVASPPISLSPLRQMVEEVRGIVDRIQNFWKGSRDLALVKSFGSPVQ